MGDAAGRGSDTLRARTCHRSGNRAPRSDNRTPLHFREVVKLPSVNARRFCTAPSMHRPIAAVCQVADISGGRVQIEDSDDYLARLRIAAKPAIAKSAPSMPIAHSESVGIPVPRGATRVTTTFSFAALQVFAVAALLASPL
jgi:hypothetical protein